MTTMKRLAVMLAALMMLVSVASAEINLRVAWWGSQVRNDKTTEVCNMYVSGNPDVKIETEFSDYGGYFEKLATQVAGNALPDVLQMDRGYLAQYVNKGQLLDLTPYIESGLLDTTYIPAESINTGKVGDGVYALVLGVNVPCLFYDKAVTDAAGVEITNNMTQADFMAACKTIYEKTGVQTDLDYGKDTTYLSLYMRGRGSHLIAEDGTRLYEDTPALLEDFFRLYTTGLEEGYLLPAEIFAELDVNAVEQNALVLGKSWCTILFSNQLSAIASAAGREISMASVPADDVKALQYVKPSMYFSVSANSENKDEAVKFISYFVNDRKANEVILGDRGVPANTDVAAYIAPLMSEADQQGIAFVNEVSENCSDIDAPAPEGMSEIESLTNRLLESVCYRVTTPEAAAEELFTKANEILAKNK